MTEIAAKSWRLVGGWIVRLLLILFIAFEVEIWLDILLFQPEEYERLIGSESACGVAKSYCSWRAFILDNVPLATLSVLSAIALLWRGLPKRELMLGALVVAFCGYLAWRAYGVWLETELSGSCCEAPEGIA
jgi:hypothetical protein